VIVSVITWQLNPVSNPRTTSIDLSPHAIDLPSVSLGPNPASYAVGSMICFAVEVAGEYNFACGSIRV
jgi:hypothetical protein